MMKTRKLNLLFVILVIIQVLGLGCSGGEPPLNTSAPANEKFQTSRGAGGNSATDSATTKTD